MKTYKERQAEIREEQEGMTKDEVMELMKKRSEAQVDLDNLPTKVYEHNWVDRGAKLSCETDTHPNHVAWKR